MRIVIVGGGLGGLTLANCLQHAGIDFVLLEGREKIGLHVGAGIGIEPNGDRILDQLGVYADLEDKLIPNRGFIIRNYDGKLLYDNDISTLVKHRTGYYPWVFERRVVLEALYNRIWDKSKVLVGKRVRGIVYEDDRASVICDDGSKHVGDVIVGGDGVHSVILKEMWRICDLQEPGRITDKDKKYLSAEYRGLYGFSSEVPGIDPGTMTFVIGKDQLCYWMTGKDGRIYWCLVEKLDAQVHAPNIPRYSDKDALDYAEARLDKTLLSDTVKIKFGDLWARRQAWALITVEEGDLGVWTAGRIVCMGDIVHKFTPESGQGWANPIEGTATLANQLELLGANQSIESAASLANHLKLLMDNCSEKGPTTKDIETCLAKYQSKRHPRASEVVEATNQHVRVFTFRKPVLKLIATYITPLLGDFQANVQSQRHVGAERIEYLPIPARSVTGTMPFNSTMGVAKYESRGRRALIFAPLLLGVLSYSFAVPVNRFSSPMLQLQAMPIYFFWLLEGSRRANELKAIRWIILFGALTHIYGFTLWSQIWFFLYYVWSPIEVYAALDQRLVQMNYARALLPTIVLAAVLPLVMIMIYADSPAGQRLLSLGSWSPIVLTLTHRLFANLCQDTTKHDRLHNPKADLPYLRRAFFVAGVTAFVSTQYLRYNKAVFGPIWFTLSISPLPAPPDPATIVLHGSQLFWLLLLFRDLKKAKMIKENSMTVFAYIFAGWLGLGPEATFIAAWAWREEVLASKRHWAAITTAG